MYRKYYNVLYLFILMCFILITSGKCHGDDQTNTSKSIFVNGIGKGYHLVYLNLDEEGFEDILSTRTEHWTYGKTKGYVFFRITKLKNKNATNDTINTKIFGKLWKTNCLNKKIGDEYWFQNKYDESNVDQDKIIKYSQLYFTKGNYFIEVIIKSPYPFPDEQVENFITEIATYIDLKL